jgi:hypothetical protein
VRSLELQAKIDAYYEQWRKSRSKWNAPRGRWYVVIQKLRQLDTYRYVPPSPLTSRDLVSLRAVLSTSVPTRMFHWSVRRDGEAILIKRLDTW